MPNHRRFFIEDNLYPGASVTISGNTAAQIANVLRLTSGDKISLLNGKGEEYLATIATVRSSAVNAVINSVEHPETELPFKLTAVIGRTKPAKIELVIQKATELGVRSFVILECAHAIGTPPDQKKIDRWKKIAIEAMEQCGGTVLPEISCIGLDDINKVISSANLALFACEHGEHQPIIGTLLHKRLHFMVEAPNQRENCITGKEVVFICGPEGGFRDNETDMMVSFGAVPVSLGKRILRAETAVLAGCAAIALFPWT